MKNRLTLVVNNGSIAGRAKNSNESGKSRPVNLRDFLCLNEYASNGVIYGGSAENIIPVRGIILHDFRHVFSSRHQCGLKSLNGGDVKSQPKEAFMTTITILDLNTEVNHEPRILDVRLAESLGFARPTNIRKLIKRHADALEQLAPLSTVERVINGGEAVEYYLNKMQALYICTKSETEKATEITLEVVRVYDTFTSSETKAVTDTPKVSNSKLNLPAIISRLECAIMAVHEIDVCFAHQADALRSHTLNLRGKLEAITDLCGEPRRFIQAQILPAEQAKLLRRVA